MYESEFKDILTASRNHVLTFFVGAGVSKISGAPKWSELINSLCVELNKDTKEKYTSDEYLQIPQMYYYKIKKDNDKYYDFIKDKIIVPGLKPNVVHYELLKLNPVSFITTNYDDLIENAAMQQCLNFKSIACDKDVPNIYGDRFVLKIHGDFLHKNIVLKEEDYLNYSYNFKLIETLLKSIFSTNMVVFIGYSLNDYDMNVNE